METWKKDIVVYQIYPRSFKDSNDDGIGDLAGIIEKVPYLANLGVNALWLSPVYKSPMDDNGYDISDYCDIHHEYGSLETMKTLIHTLHEHGIKLIMDLVINHTSDEHPWFIESRKNTDNPKRDYYIWKKRNHRRKTPNNWTSFFTGKAWTYDKTTDSYYLHLFSRKQPDLNWDNPEVVEAVKEIITFWTSLGVDGFRLDVINLIAKDPTLPNGRRRIALTGREHYMNKPRAHLHLKHLNEALFSPLGILTVGETVFVTTEEALAYVGFDRGELDMVFHFEHMGVDNWNKWFILPFKPRKLKRIMDKWQLAFHGKGWNALYFENHDQPRSVSRFGDDKRYWKESAKMLATILYFQQGTPYIYQGQEIGMTNADFTSLDAYRDIETHNVYKLGRQTLKFSHRRMMGKIRYMSRDNARTPMQWHKGKHAGFSKVDPWIGVNKNHLHINVDDALKDPDSIYHYYKTIIVLRKAYPVIVHGDYVPYLSKHKKLVMYTRNDAQDSLLIVANFSKSTVTFTLPKPWRDASHELLLCNYGDDLQPRANILEPYEARVYRQSK